MARYRKIDTRIWNDAKFRTLSDNGKLAFFFLLTHPHMTSLGAMRGTIRGLASEIGWGEKLFRESFREISERDMAEHDEVACFIGLPNFLKYNSPESPNVVKSWVDSLDLLPECNHKVRLLQRVKAFAEGLSEGFAKALPKAFDCDSETEGLGEAFRKGMPYQEQEQEHKQEQEQDVTPKSPDLISDFVSIWNTTQGVRHVRKIGNREATLKTRLRDPEWDWRAALAKFPLKLVSSDPSGWVPDLDFFLRPDSVTKILEGKYDWEKKNGQRTLGIGPGQTYDASAGIDNPNFGKM